MPAPAISFDTQLRLEDFRAYYLFTVWIKQKLLLPALVFAFGVGALLLPGGGWRLWAGVALLTAVFCYCWSRLRLWPRFKQALADQMDEKYRVSVSDKGILMDNLDRQQKVMHGWDGIVEARELKKYFLLYQGHASALILPKRSMSLLQQTELDKKIRQRLGAKYSYA